jgi:hypothetical protein
MAENLGHQDVRVLLERARESFPHDACLTCECFLGCLTQLGIDAGEQVQSLLAESRVDRGRSQTQGRPGGLQLPDRGGA